MHPCLYFHHTRQWQTEAKHLADELLEAAAGAPTLAPSNTSTSTFFSDTDDAKLIFSNTSADNGEKSAIASRGMAVSQMPAES